LTELVQSAQTRLSKIVVCVGAVVIKNNQALFIRHARGHSLEGQWTIPWGVVEPGESPDVAALREVREEASVTAAIEGLLGIQSLPQPWEGWLAIAFLCRHVSGEPVPDGGVETDRAAYFSQEKMDAFNEPFEHWCDWLVRRALRRDHHLIPAEPGSPYYPQPSFL
jgi:ADP-ribose pyrophosphatase YjhB (NUDIX family)